MIGFLNTSYTVDESDGVVSLQIGAIQGSLQRSVVIELTTRDMSTDGSLIAKICDTYLRVLSLTGSSDYRGLIGQQYILNSTRNTINVTIINDNVFEQTELFRVSLTLSGSVSSRVTLAASSAQVSILDNDDDSKFNGTCMAWHSRINTSTCCACAYYIIEGNSKISSIMYMAFHARQKYQMEISSSFEMKC